MPNMMIFDLHSLDGLSCTDLTCSRLNQLTSSARARRWDVIPIIAWRPGIAPKLRALLSDITQIGSTIHGLGLRFEDLPLRDEINNLASLRKMGLSQIQLPEHILQNPGEALVILKVFWEEGLPIFFNIGRHTSDEERRLALSSFTGAWSEKLPAIFRYSDAPPVQDLLCNLAWQNGATICIDFRNNIGSKAALIRRIGLNHIIVGCAYDDLEIIEIPSTLSSDDENIWDVIATRGYRGQLHRLREANFTEAEIEFLTSEGPRRTFTRRPEVSEWRVKMRGQPQ